MGDKKPGRCRPIGSFKKSGTRLYFLSSMQMSTTVRAARLEETIQFMARSNVSKTHRPHYCVEAVLFTR
jgi:hypothetical protein